MPEKTSRDLEKARRAVEEALRDLEVLEMEMKREGQYETGARIDRWNHFGTVAATRKRLAEVQFLAGESRPVWRETLRQASEDYRTGLTQGIKLDHWQGGQYLVLRSVLNLARETHDFEFLWQDTVRTAQAALMNPDPFEKMWSHSTLADLRLVGAAEQLSVLMGEKTAMVMTEGSDSATEVTVVPSALDDLKNMVREGGGPRLCPALWPTFRQFWRWHRWWTDRPEWKESARQGYEYLWSLVEPQLRERSDPTPEVAGTGSE